MITFTAKVWFVCSLMAPGIAPYGNGGIFCNPDRTYTSEAACKTVVEKEASKYSRDACMESVP